MTVMDDSLAAASDTQTPSDGGKDAFALGRAAAGDVRAFEQLVAGHKARIGRLVYRLLGWDQEAEDVVQDVFLAALKGSRKFRGRSSMGAWLTRIAVNECRSHQRRRVLWRKLKKAFRPRAVSAAPADGEAMDRETFDRVRRAVRELPTAAREVVVLRYLEGMSVEEICRVLGVSPNAVQVRLHRARQRLKRSLSELFEETTR